jgi:hypothetical protein
MTSSLWAAATVTSSSKRIAFGPFKDKLPLSFKAEVVAVDLDLQTVIDCRFGGDRIEVVSHSVSRPSGGPLTPRDVVKVPLAWVVQQAGMGELHPDDRAHLGRRPGRKPTPEELELLAGVYWVQHATWGLPRQAVMAIWGLPRATANRWITKAAALYPLPPRLTEMS